MLKVLKDAYEFEEVCVGSGGLDCEDENDVEGDLDRAAANAGSTDLDRFDGAQIVGFAVIADAIYRMKLCGDSYMKGKLRESTSEPEVSI